MIGWEANLFLQRAATAVALSLTLMGCQTEPSGSGNMPVAVAPNRASATSSDAIAFRCPLPGAAVTYSNGITLRYTGAEPNDPFVCLRRNANGDTQRLLYNVYPLPAVNEQAIRAGMARLWPASQGGSSSFVYISETTAGGGHTSQFQQRWRVERRERLSIGGNERDTVVLTRVREGMLGNNFHATNTLWVDVATGLTVRSDIAVTRGVSNEQNVVATAITAPGN